MADLLLVDAGNTRLKWAFSRGGLLSPSGQVAYADRPVFSDLWDGVSRPQRILLASVADEKMTTDLRQWFQSSWDVPLEMVTARRRACGVENCYENPERLGADRWAAMIAAHRRFAGNVCVIDCGSATTVDVVTARGRHLGGLIIPGLDLLRSSLCENMAAIRGRVDDFGSGLLACETLSAVGMGSLQATVGLIERVQGEVAKQVKGTLTSVICGGNAADLLPLLSGEVHPEPDLVLQGLNIIAMDEA